MLCSLFAGRSEVGDRNALVCGHVCESAWTGPGRPQQPRQRVRGPASLAMAPATWRVRAAGRALLLAVLLVELGALEGVSADLENHWSFYYESPCCGHDRRIRHHKGKPTSAHCNFLGYHFQPFSLNLVPPSVVKPSGARHKPRKLT